MKTIYLLPVLIMLSCKKEPAQTTPVIDNPKPTEKIKPATTVVSPLDFDGDGNDDDITVTVLKGEGNPVEDGTPDSYTLYFKNGKLPELPLGCCEPLTVGEGDLNGDGRAELTILQAPMNGCTHNLTIWSFQNKKWRQVFGPEMVPTACEGVNANYVDSLIVKENGRVYFYKTDPDDEDFKKVKTEIKL